MAKIRSIPAEIHLMVIVAAWIFLAVLRHAPSFVFTIFISLIDSGLWAIEHILVVRERVKWKMEEAKKRA